MILYGKEEKETVKEYAYRVLKGNIMSLQLKPGELISELELSEKLNLSRTPIREVIMKLKSEHLIEVKPQSGTYVSLIDMEMIEEAVFMRFSVEEKVLENACEYFPDNIIIELEKNLFAQEIIANMVGGEEEFHKLDTDFHELIFKGVRKNNVWDSILNISTHYNRMRLLTQKKDSKQDVVKQHKEFLDIIKHKEKDKVKSLINEHMEFSKKSWEYITKHDEEISKYFKIL
ncbi:MAG: GntR family transcriptional regulator [Peptostreptococcaceae bacterium]